MKISIIVPCYNSAQWLPLCLDSLINQTHKDLEILAINDGSTDETGDVIDAYAAKDPRIRAIHQRNSGLVAVREKGIELATGDYIGFVDGDDSVTPDMFERLLCNALKYGAEISHCGMAFVWPDGSVDKHYGTGEVVVQDSFEGVRDLLVGQRIEPSLCNKLYSRKLVKNSCLDISVLNNEDLLRNFTLFSRAQKIVFEDFCGYHYFQRPGSMSKDTTKIVRSFWHIEKARRLILNNCSQEIKPYAIRCWLSSFVNAFNHNYGCTDAEILSLCQKCREILKKEKQNVHYLVPRQQIAAYLIIYTPWLHRIVYRIYNSRR